MTKKKKTHSENKESENVEKDVKVEEEVISTKEEVTMVEEKVYTPAPHGKGGQYVDIGGGVKVPASEVDQK